MMWFIPASWSCPVISTTRHPLERCRRSHRESGPPNIQSGRDALAHRVTKRLLAARAAFKQRVCGFLRTVGASPSDGAYEWILDTPIGELGVSLWDNAIVCRFAEVEKGTEFTRVLTAQSCNPYSGKWNWHFADDADTLNGNCEAQFVRYVTLLMSLGALPADLSALTPDQTEHCVARLSRFTLAELRRHQDLTNRQIELAFQQRNAAALANLHVRAEHLRLAVDRKTFGSRSVDCCRSG
jgi:hypothetical protein